MFGGGCMEWKVTEQGPRAVIEVRRTDDGQGLYKAWLVGQGGRCLLGTLAPEGGQLGLRRSLSIDSLRRGGTWPICAVEEEMVCCFAKSQLNWQDAVLCRMAQNLPPHTVRRVDTGLCLRFPFDPYKPFPLPPLFCFARLEQGHLLFFFAQDGTPQCYPAQENPQKG